MAAQEENPAPEEKGEEKLSWLKIALCTLGALLCLYIFLVGLSLMGGSFKVLGGRGASSLFSAVDNPISGLMTGILATVLVQSSSTSTSIVVAMVGEGALTVKMGIPIIMGANIGTTVTNSIVSMGQSGDKLMLQRAFAGATVHDMFNMLTVATLLPIEAIIAAIQGDGGPLYWISHAITEGLMGGEGGDKLFKSPVKVLAAPIVDGILKSNKYVIYALTLEKPTEMNPTTVNQTLCAPLNTTRRLSASDAEEVPVADSRALLSRRTSALEDCSTYYCVTKDLDKQFKKISSSSYEKLTECGDRILDGDGKPCGDKKCYMDGGKYWDEKVENGRLIKGGFLKETSDGVGGALGLVLSLIFLCVGLYGLCKCLQMIFIGNAKKVLHYATKVNGYLAIAIGIGITIIVQSSSVTTSALTPLCGLGVLPLDKMLPLTLGANIGTTVTALVASLVSLKFGAVQIALCHLLFNITGILIWYPFPPMRNIPLEGARLLGVYAAHYKFLPPLYILVMFVCVPGVCFLIRAIFLASVAAGVIVLLLVLAGFVAFEYMWWIGMPGDEPLCYKVLSREDRAAEAENAENAETPGAAGDGKDAV